MRSLCASVVLLLCLAVAAQHGARASRIVSGQADANQPSNKHHKSKKRYSSPAGLFIQERASKQLPGPGQHFSFGALKPWDQILSMLDGKPNRKLVFIMRHGQAVSNYLGETLGPDEWFAVEGTCSYDNKQGTVYQIFDAGTPYIGDLTSLGEDQVTSLHSMLTDGGWFDKVTGGRPARAVISPLTRCLRTATIALGGLRFNRTDVEELVRETLGEDTCDARRSISDPDPRSHSDPSGPCPFEHGLAALWPQFRFNIARRGGATSAGAATTRGQRLHQPHYDNERSFGLISDEDTLWTKDKRERQSGQVKRARAFLDILFAHAPEQVIWIVTHSGFARSLLLAVRREPYRPVNAELVPAIIDKASDDGWVLDAAEDAELRADDDDEEEEEASVHVDDGGDGVVPARISKASTEDGWQSLL